MYKIKSSSIFAILILFLLVIYIYILNTSNNLNETPNILKIHYIDVGQGDATLIQSNNKNILIDAGPKDSEDNLILYLKGLKIKTLDYVIATHPHEDHIGGMSSIIENFKIYNFLAPKTTSNSQSFEYMIYSLIKKNLKITPIINSIIDLGNTTTLSFFTLNSSNLDNLNNYSPIIKLNHINTSFLFTGDAEKEVEDTVISSTFNLKSTVLKLGHHGSSTSTSENFLKAVNPKLGIISVGLKNNYGHPAKSILSLLNNNKIPYYRTDEDGTIVIISNGYSLTIE